MARKYGRILSSIWRDPDWRTLSADAQRVYLLALSQPDLRLTGVVPYIPQRWAAFAADTTPEAIETAVRELEAARFVVADLNSQELLIRSLCRYELTGSTPQMAGFWAAWTEIWSEELRGVIVRELERLSDTDPEPVSDTHTRRPRVDNLWTNAPAEVHHYRTASHAVSDTHADTDPAPVSDRRSGSVSSVRETGTGNRETGTGNSEHVTGRSEHETGNRDESPPATSPPDTPELEVELDFELVDPGDHDRHDSTRTIAAALDDLCGKPPSDTAKLNQRRDAIRQLVATLTHHHIPPTAESVSTLAGLYRADMTASLTDRALANHADRLITQATNGRLKRTTPHDIEDATRHAEYAALAARKRHELGGG